MIYLYQVKRITPFDKYLEKLNIEPLLVTPH
nr:MAG TPA: hypothetical protein [Caudoviricetes sp.]